jgi:hypothetical protein
MGNVKGDEALTTLGGADRASGWMLAGAIGLKVFWEKGFVRPFG